MQKSFKNFLAESVRTYKYRLKIVGDVDQKLMQLIEINLQKFSVVKMGTPKSTPIQKTLPDFPEQENNSVTIVDVEFKYPVIEPFVKQIARLIGLDENKVRLVSLEHDDNDQADGDFMNTQRDHSPLLNHEELEDKGKEANKEYGDMYLSSIKKQTEGDKIKQPFDAKETPVAHDPFKKHETDKSGLSSPFSKMKKQPLPATGAHK